MKRAYHIWLTVYCKPEDDKEKVMDNFRRFLPMDPVKEKIRIGSRSADIIEERKIEIFWVHLEKTRHTNAFIDNLKGMLNDEQKKLLVKQAESRLDSGHHFFVRIDKDKLIDDGSVFITDKGNCYHIKIAIAAFPTTRDNSLQMVADMFS